MKITAMNLWTIDYSSVDEDAGGALSGQPRPENETYCVEIETDIGETGVAANRGGGSLSCEIIDTYFRPLLKGANPVAIEGIWQQMNDSLPATRGALTRMAMSGVDLALWDLQGKVTGKPVYELLGGPVREKLPCYVTVTADDVGHLADDGFLGVKLPVEQRPADGPAGINAVEEMVRETRETVGPEMEVMIDCFMSWDREYTLRVANRLEPYEVKWIEDPLPAGHAVERYRDVRQSLHPIQVAVGNVEYDHQSFHQLVNGNAADIIQPDVQWVGGLTELCRIGNIAKPQGVPLIPHRSNPYSCHYAMAQPDTPYVEYMLGSGTKAQPVRPAIEGEPVPEDGTITLNDEPGFGIRLDDNILESFGNQN